MIKGEFHLAIKNRKNKNTIAEAKKSNDRPTLIMCKTHIGKGSPNRANTSKAHGEPLGAEEIKLTRESLGWNFAPFVIPKDVYADWDAKAKGKAAEAAWNAKFAAYKAAYPALAKELLRRMKGDLPKNFVQTAVDTVIAPTKKQRPWPAARHRNWRWKPSPPQCPNCWVALPI